MYPPIYIHTKYFAKQIHLIIICKRAQRISTVLQITLQAEIVSKHEYIRTGKNRIAKIQSAVFLSPIFLSSSRSISSPYLTSNKYLRAV